MLLAARGYILTPPLTYATKLLTSGGEGGMVIGDDAEALARVRDAHTYDERSDLAPRWNYKLTDLQAAVGLVQLSRFEDFIARRREIARRYGERLAVSSLELPGDPPDGRDVYHRYVVSLPDSWIDENGGEGPRRAIDKLEEKGIAARRPVFKPLHVLMGESGFPGAESAWMRHLSLPIYPTMIDDEADAVAEAVLSLFPDEAPK